jgi:hypothetical protein
MDRARRDHVWLLVNQKRDMDRARRELSAEVTAAIMEACGDREKVDVPCLHRARRTIAVEIWPRYYGRFNAAPESSRFGQAIITATDRAWNLGWRRGADMLSRHLTRFAPDLLVALREMARAKDDGTIYPPTDVRA